MKWMKWMKWMACLWVPGFVMVVIAGFTHLSWLAWIGVSMIYVWLLVAFVYLIFLKPSG